MALPVVYLANRRKLTLQLQKQFPGRVGVLYSVGVNSPSPLSLPWVLDNGCYPAWQKQQKWLPAGFLRLLSKAAGIPTPPQWVVVPDVVADKDATLRQWAVWAHIIRDNFGYPLAVAVQDGMYPRHIEALRPEPDVIFVGGTTRWKWRTLPMWTKAFPRVHVGRANTHHMLWSVQYHGAESSDGTGWWHHIQLQDLKRYLDRSTRGLSKGRKGLVY
jgi:hypothetical protein